jgi:hypothetical protein
LLLLCDLWPHLSKVNSGRAASRSRGAACSEYRLAGVKAGAITKTGAEVGRVNGPTPAAFYTTIPDSTLATVVIAQAGTRPDCKHEGSRL